MGDVKSALRDLQTNYILIGATKTSRIAAAEDVRTLLAKEQTIQGYTPEFLNLKLQRQEALAGAEQSEITALIDYNTAMAQLYTATGTGLERNGVSFSAPNAIVEPKTSDLFPDFPSSRCAPRPTRSARNNRGALCRPRSPTSPPPSIASAPAASSPSPPKPCTASAPTRSVRRRSSRIYLLKDRLSINPLIVHVSGPDMAAKLVADWTPDAAALARMFWPGPLTLVLPRPVPGTGTATHRVASSPNTPIVGQALPLIVPDIVPAGGPTIAVRCPDHPVALSLLFGLGSPLVGPSANLSGGVSPTTAAHVRESFDPADVLILEGGPCRAGIESTVVSLAADRPRILRPGLIGAGEIATIIGRPVEEHAPASASSSTPSGPLPSPGLLARHYAPRTPARLLLADEIRWLLQGHTGSRGFVVIAHERMNIPPPHTLLVLPNDAQDFAFEIYAALRRADEQSPEAILIQRPPSDEGAWGAILDRLTRATAPP